MKPLKPEHRDANAAHVYLITDGEGQRWRLLDVIAGSPGIHRLAVVTGSDDRATHRYFINDANREVRCYEFASEGSRSLTLNAVAQQLRSSAPTRWM